MGNMQFTGLSVGPATPKLLGAAPAAPAMKPLAAAPKQAGSDGLIRETYTADNTELPDGQLGKLVRGEGDPAVGDAAVDMAHDNAKVVYDFYKTVLGRDSIDGKGMPLQSIAHYGKDFNNAYWDGERMTYGDGDGRVFSPLSGALDVVGHEMTHGVTERTSGLRYQAQPGALNESWSDVFGELIEQWHERPKTFNSVEGAKQGDWLIGEDVFTPGTPGDALRSMKAPGTAYKGDPQPATMSDYKKMTDDNGGVHVNSGIPNKAAYEVAIKLGGEKTAQIWYKAMTDYIRDNAQFSDAANATVSAARDLFHDGSEVQAVRDAWKSVGLTPKFVDAVGAGKGVVSQSHTEQGHEGGVVPTWLRHGIAPGPGLVA